MRCPTGYPGFQDILDDEARTAFDRAWGTTIQPRYGKHLTAMFEAMEHGELRTVFCLGENPAQSEADITRARRLLQGLDHLVVQDIFLTKTAELAHVVLPATAAWCESEGTVTNSERRVQRVRKALDGPEGARDDMDILLALAGRLGHEWSLWRSRRLAGDSRRGGLGRAALGLAHASRHVVRAARSSLRHPVAVL